MITPVLLYLLSGTVFLTAMMWIVGDFKRGRRAAITPRMIVIAVLWPAALLWLIGAAAWDIVDALRRG